MTTTQFQYQPSPARVVFGRGTLAQLRSHFGVHIVPYGLCTRQAELQSSRVVFLRPFRVGAVNGFLQETQRLDLQRACIATRL